jgi:hypothetical protein
LQGENVFSTKTECFHSKTKIINQIVFYFKHAKFVISPQVQFSHFLHLSGSDIFHIINK